MTLSPWIIYLWTQLDSVKELLTCLSWGGTAVGGALMFIYCIAGGDVPDALSDKMPKWAKIGIVTAIIAAILNVFVPSSKGIAMIVVLPAVVNSQPIQKDLPEFYGMAVDALKEKAKQSLEKAPEKK